MSCVAIVGTGLLGSSFGLAVRRASLFERIIGVSSPVVVEKALAVGAIDTAMPLEEALPQADLVLLAQPVKRIAALLESIDPLLKPGSLVTDVGSTKAIICTAGAKHITRGQFVGGHPMAGRELRGPDGATADLFSGRPWVLSKRCEELISIVTTLGARPVILDPEEHDRMVSLSSHLPQLVSTALASYLNPQEHLGQVAGPGLLDMTRLALSSYDLWEDILQTNEQNVDVALKGMIEQLEAVREALAAGELNGFFLRGAALSNRLRSN